MGFTLKLSVLIPQHLNSAIGCGDYDKRFAKGVFGDDGVFAGALYTMHQIFSLFFALSCWVPAAGSRLV